MKKLILLLALSVLYIPAYAIHVEYGSEVVISEPVYEDIYVAGGTITIKAPIHGDLIVAGGTVNIEDTVYNDIILGGGTVTFNGYVNDDVRCAGGTLHVFRDIRGDLVVAGGSVTIDKDVTIGNLLISGGEVIVDGIVNGDVQSAAGEFTLNGTIQGSMQSRSGAIHINGVVKGKSELSATDIILGTNAAFYDDVRYWRGKGKIDFGAHVKQGIATYDPALAIQSGKWVYLGFASFMAVLFYLLAAGVMIWIIQYLFSATMRRAAKNIVKHPGASIGYGFLFFIAVPVAIIVTFITVIGIPVGLLLTAGYIILMLLASVITSVVIANWFANRSKKTWSLWHYTWVAFLVFAGLKIISPIPVLGWLVLIALTCLAFGGIILRVWQAFRAVRQQPVEPTTFSSSPIS